MAARMVATDLDGTFLSSDGRAAPENLEAVREAARRGIKLVIATGRPARWLSPLEPLREHRPYVLTSNGAVIFDLRTQSVLDASILPLEDTLAVAADLREALPSAAFAVEYTQGWGREGHYPLRGDMVEADVIGGPEQLLTSGRAVKLLVRGLEVDTRLMAEVAEPICADRLTCTFSMISRSGLLELSGIGVDKGSGLRRLMTVEEITRDELVAFGDMPNDLTMLELAGRAFAMDNAHHSLLARFPAAGHHNEAGVGRTLLRLLAQDD